MAAERTCFGAPNPAPKSQDRHRFGGEGEIFAAIAFWLPRLGVLVDFCIHLCEIVAILARKFPSPLSDSVLSVLLKRPDDADNLAITLPFVIGFILAIAGGVGRKKCFEALGRFFTFQLALHNNHKLITTGPYAIVRHPSYTAVLMVEFGSLITIMLPGSYLYESGMLTTAWGAVPLILWGIAHGPVSFLALTRPPVEDAVLKREFGDQWDAWAKKTPYALIPYIY